jgi:hypothetical protein
LELTLCEGAVRRVVGRGECWCPWGGPALCRRVGSTVSLGPATTAWFGPALVRWRLDRTGFSELEREVGEGMGSRVELFERIGRGRGREGLSIRALAWRHGVHRRAEWQALAAPLPPPRRRTGRRPAPKLGP